MLDANPLDADAYFVRGLAELGLGDAGAAVTSLRRALYIDPRFGLAAFKLARAHELHGDRPAAARAYEQALHTLDPDDSRHDAILDQVDVADVAVACSLGLRRLQEGRA
jgi:Tfp pilus assembly protein PilF